MLLATATRQPTTNGPAWHSLAHLPADLPTTHPTLVAAPDSPLITARYGNRDTFGTGQLDIGLRSNGFRMGGTFEQAVAAAHELASKSTEASRLNVVSVVQSRGGWLLLSTEVDHMVDGTVGHVTNPFTFDDTPMAPTMVRSSYRNLLALVGPDHWIDMRPRA